MKIIIYALFISFGLVPAAFTCYGQSSPLEMADGNESGRSSFKVGANYLSNNVFMGRADTIKTPTLNPSLKFTFSNGIYLLGDVEFIGNRKKSKIDGGTIAAGYDFDIGDNMDGSVSFTKLFFNTNSTQVGSAITGTVSANLNYDIDGIITPTLGADYNFLKKGFGNDIVLNFGISHEFSIAGSDDDALLTLSPALDVNSGTQNFYDAYLTVKKHRLLATSQQAFNAAQKASLSRFTLLDYEFSMPLEFKPGRFIISFNPTYAIAKSEVPTRTGAIAANPNGVFYFETGVSLKF